MARTKSRKSNLDNHYGCGLGNLTVAFNMIVAARVESPFRDDLRGEDLLSFGTTLIRRYGLTQLGNMICGHLLNDDAMVSFFVFIFKLLTLQAYNFSFKLISSLDRLVWGSRLSLLSISTTC
jgi:hypothetical protein